LAEAFAKKSGRMRKIGEIGKRGVEMTLEEAAARYGKDPFATKALGAVIEEVGDGYAKCSVELRDIHRNSAGNVMGGVPAVLADFCFAVASDADANRIVTLNSSITYLGMAKDGRLIAEGRRIKDGRSTCCYTVDITDGVGTQVVVANITGFRMR